MFETQQPYRQPSVSNHSSIITPKIKKRINDYSKDMLIFSEILKISKSQLNNNQKPNQKQEIVSNTSKYNSKIDHKKDQPQIHQTTITPCQDLSSLFINHKLSSQYIHLLEKKKYQNLVIISIILPTQIMKKLSKFLDFQQQYRISIPQTPFFTDFLPLNQANQSNYVFWTYEVSENEQNLRNSNKIGGKSSPSSVRSLKESKYKRVTTESQYNNNVKSMMVQASQIVITTKRYIEQHLELFFPSLGTDMAASSYHHSNTDLVNLSQLDIERTLLYFDEQQINQSSKSIPENRYLESSSNLIKEMKIKNPELDDPSYIQIQPDEEEYDLDSKSKDRNLLIPKSPIDKIPTSRSRQRSNHNIETERDQKLQLFELLQKQSIFKHVSYLLPFWMDNNSSTYLSQQGTKQGRKRKNSFNHKSIELQKCHKFRLFLNQQIKSSLKRNYTYSMFCSSWIFLHFLTNFYQTNIADERKNYNEQMKHQHTSYSTLLEKSLKTFKKQIQLRFIHRIQNEYKGLMDEGSLRNILRSIKTNEIIFMKKNFALIPFPTQSNLKMAKSYVLPQQQVLINKEYITEIQQQILTFMDKFQEQIYFQNNKQAVIYNEKVLQTEFQHIIKEGFKREKLLKKNSLESNPSLDSDERTFVNHEMSSRKKISSQVITSQLQKDFNDFIDAYWSKGIKVSSQLKTFNDFMEKNKKSYLKNISELTKQKKNHQKEEQQKQNKKRTIKLLQMEIFKLEDKKKEVRQKNQLIKKQVKNVEQRIQIQQRNEYKILKQRSMYQSGTNRLNDKDKILSSNGKKLNDSASLSFQIENKKKSRKSLPKGSTKSNKTQQNLQNSQKKKANKDQKQIQKSSKNRCLNVCCLIM